MSNAPAAATRNERTTAGPAYCAAAVPVTTKTPAPRIAPMPTVVRSSGPRTRRNPDEPSDGRSDGIIRRFPGDRHVVWVRLAQSRGRDAHELRLRTKLVDRGAA